MKTIKTLPSWVKNTLLFMILIVVLIAIIIYANIDSEDILQETLPLLLATLIGGLIVYFIQYKFEKSNLKKLDLKKYNEAKAEAPKLFEIFSKCLKENPTYRKLSYNSIKTDEEKILEANYLVSIGYLIEKKIDKTESTGNTVSVLEYYQLTRKFALDIIKHERESKKPIQRKENPLIKIILFIKKSFSIKKLYSIISFIVLLFIFALIHMGFKSFMSDFFDYIGDKNQETQYRTPFELSNETKQEIAAISQFIIPLSEAAGKDFGKNLSKTLTKEDALKVIQNESGMIEKLLVEFNSYFTKRTLPTLFDNFDKKAILSYLLYSNLSSLEKANYKNNELKAETIFKIHTLINRNYLTILHGTEKEQEQSIQDFTKGLSEILKNSSIQKSVCNGIQHNTLSCLSYDNYLKVTETNLREFVSYTKKFNNKKQTKKGNTDKLSAKVISKEKPNYQGKNSSKKDMDEATKKQIEINNRDIFAPEDKQYTVYIPEYGITVKTGLRDSRGLMFADETAELQRKKAEYYKLGTLGESKKKF